MVFSFLLPHCSRRHGLLASWCSNTELALSLAKLAGLVVYRASNLPLSGVAITVQFMAGGVGPWLLV